MITPSNTDRMTPDDIAARVRIWSGEHRAWWRPGGYGYTSDIRDAWVLDRPQAESLTAHCGPEKSIRIRTVVPGDAISDFERGKAEAFEEAAKIADEFERQDEIDNGAAMTGAAGLTAAAIRSRKLSPGKETTT